MISSKAAYLFIWLWLRLGRSRVQSILNIILQTFSEPALGRGMTFPLMSRTHKNVNLNFDFCLQKSNWFITVQVNACAKPDAIPLRWSWDTAFTRPKKKHVSWGHHNLDLLLRYCIHNKGTDGPPKNKTASLGCHKLWHVYMHITRENKIK